MRSMMSRHVMPIIGMLGLLASPASFAATFHMVEETDTGSDLYFSSYDSFLDLLDGTSSFYMKWNGGLTSSYSIAGLTHDGSRFVMAGESDTGSDVFFVTFDSFQDLIAGNNSTFASWGGSLSSSYSFAGLTYDGSRYVMAGESDVGSDVFFVTFDSYQALLAGNNSTFTFWGASLSSSYSFAGLAYDGSRYIMAGESDVGSDVFFMTFDSFQALVDGNHSTFTTWGGSLSSNRSVRGLTAVESIAPVPVPAAAVSFVGALGMLGAVPRRRRG